MSRICSRVRPSRTSCACCAAVRSGRPAAITRVRLSSNSGQPLPPRLPRVGGQVAPDGAVRGCRDACLLKNPQAVELADGLNDPRHHQVPEHVIIAGRRIQAQSPVAAFKGVEQVPHPRGRDRQRPGRRRVFQAEIEFQLAVRDPLAGSGLQRLKLRLVVRRPDVLDVPGPAPRRPHDLHRRRTRLGLHRPYIRHSPTLRSRPQPRGPDGKPRAQREPAAFASS